MKRPVDRLRAVGDEGPQLAVAQDASRGYGHPGMVLFFDACTTYPAEAFLHTLTLWRGCHLCHSETRALQVPGSDTASERYSTGKKGT